MLLYIKSTTTEC